MSKIKIFSLGGLNEVGKNMYIVDVDNDIFVFDAGLKYADDRMLGIDYIIPNYDYLKENINRIKGIFVTHGHSQHMGALTDIFKDLPSLKIYGTNFTLDIIRQEFISEGLNTDNLIEIKPHKKIVFGNNSIFPINLTHSVPDNVGYVLNTLDGAIFYTGNFVFDPTMLGSYATDIGKLGYIGKQGVLCLMSESLYADKKGFTSPNHRASSVIKEAINRNEGRIIFNVFPTQIYRIQELFNEVKNTNRNIVFMGKHLQTIINDAIDKGYLEFDKSKLVSIHHVNDPGVIVIVSDEREKPFSNINRIVKGYDKFIKLNEEDTVVFISPIYEGMERSAVKIFDSIAKIGANLITISSKKYLSHHASKEDLLLMLSLINPKYYFPVIGEYRHQVENKLAAMSIGLNEEDILLKLNGQVVTFVDGKFVDNGETIKINDILVDGKTPGDIGEIVLRDREALSDNGIVIVSTAIDKKTKDILAGPEVLTRGFIYVKDNAELIKETEKICLKVIKENTKPNYIEFNKVKNGIRDELGKFLYEQTECKPMILVVMQEV